MMDLIKAIVSIQPPFNMIVLICSAAGVLSTIASQIRKYTCHRQEIEFKRELVDRGLTADEIERIVNARMPKRVELEEVGV